MEAARPVAGGKSRATGKDWMRYLPNHDHRQGRDPARHHRGPRVSYATLTAALALTIGVANVGATTLVTGRMVRDGTLTGRDVRDRAITAQDVGDGSVSALDVRHGSLGQ